MLDEETKNYVIQRLLKNIYSISDTEYQRRVWIRGEGPECSDYGETVCNFFSCMRGIISHCDEYHFTHDQLAALLKFQKDFDYFELNYECPMDCFEDEDNPEWAKIREEAKEVLQTFNYKPGPFRPYGPWESYLITD